MAMRCFGRAFLAGFDLAAARLQGEAVFLIAPIQADAGLGRLSRGIGLVVRVGRVVGVHVTFCVNAGRRLYRVRRETSAPEHAYPRSGQGSGREVALGSSHEQVSYSYRSPTRKYSGASFPEKNRLPLASRRRCSPAAWRSRWEGSCSAGEQRRTSYTDFQSAVAPNSIRQAARALEDARVFQRQRIGNPRYSRLETCATSVFAGQD